MKTRKLVNNSIMREIRSDKVLDYYYDSDGIRMIKISDEYYILRKNILGDITHIYKLNNNGLELHAKYIYDAWGNHVVLNPDSSENSNSDFIGNINPFRYRGYYYDVETKLYYLGARYYDSQVRRFITGDNINFISPTKINGLNVYSYCLNNPVMLIDKSGNFTVANYYFQVDQKINLWGGDSIYWGRFQYSVTNTLSRSAEETGIFYAYYSITNITEKSYHAGINLEWVGIDFGVSYGDGDYNISIGGNISPWFHFGVTIGLSGITIGAGVNIDRKSFDISFGIGLAPVAIVIGVVAIVVTGGMAIDWVSTMFSQIFAGA